MIPDNQSEIRAIQISAIARYKSQFESVNRKISIHPSTIAKTDFIGFLISVSILSTKTKNK